MINKQTALGAIRRHFHANAELSGAEINTSREVIGILKGFNPDQIVTGLGGYGVAAVFNGEAPGETVLFRCELDALPIKEVNTFDHRSQTEGVSHKCGHDGHLTILLGLAEKISANRPKKGRVILLFQPAEENGEGAKAVLEDDQFKGLEPDYVFALHNLPGYPKHQIVYRYGTFTAAVNSMIIRLSGKTAHAGEPEMGHNPASAVSRILQKALALSNNDPERDDFTIVTPVYVELGELAYGISAGEAEIHLTIRTWTEEELQKLSDRLVDMVEKESTKEKLEVSVGWTQHFSANENSEKAMRFLDKTISELDLDRQERKYPFKWGEDFGLFTQSFEGAMFGIGSGTDCPALHNPDYDFPDEILETGIKVFYGIQQSILNR